MKGMPTVKNSLVLIILFALSFNSFAIKSVENIQAEPMTIEEDQRSDSDLEVDEREFSDDELQSFTPENNSDLDHVNAENYDLNFKPWQLPQHADNRKGTTAKPRLNSFKSIFDNLFGRDNSNKSQTKSKTSNSNQNNTSSIESLGFPSGYKPANPLNESYSGQQLRIEVYKRPGGSLPEFLVAKIDGNITLVTLVSTARSGHSTSSGTFYGFHYRHIRHKSSLYHNSPMPFAQFFNGNVAFHGVLEEYYPYMGGPASAGCVRIQVDEAIRLWRMAIGVKQNVVTVVHDSGTQPPAWELSAIQSEIKESFKMRDYYIANLKNKGSRSPYWPTGYFPNYGVDY